MFVNFGITIFIFEIKMKILFQTISVISRPTYRRIQLGTKRLMYDKYIKNKFNLVVRLI